MHIVTYYESRDKIMAIIRLFSGKLILRPNRVLTPRNTRYSANEQAIVDAQATAAKLYRHQAGRFTI